MNLSRSKKFNVKQVDHGFDDTLERFSGLDINDEDNMSIYSGGKRGENRGIDDDFMQMLNDKRNNKGKAQGGAQKMANAWETFGNKGEAAPRHADALSECDERERQAIFDHSQGRGGLFGQLANSPLKDTLPKGL